jgi:di/tricarboxylate transporter
MFDLAVVLSLLAAAIVMFAINKPRLDAIAFVLGDGLVRTGVARQRGDWLISKAGSSEIRLNVLLMAALCGLGATTSATAVTVIFIPVVLPISKSTGLGPGRLMMPLNFAPLRDA